MVSNAERVTVLRPTDEDDPGAHAADPGTEGRNAGHVLTNGRCDEHPGTDTAPPAEALRTVRHVPEAGTPPPDLAWVMDR